MLFFLSEVASPMDGTTVGSVAIATITVQNMTTSSGSFTSGSVAGSTVSVATVCYASLNATDGGPVRQVVSDEVRNIIVVINMAILCQIVSAVGVVVNVINICVFARLGYGEAINVTLTGLAVSDLGIVVFAVWLSICYNPLFSSLDLPFKPSEFVYLTAGLPRLSCARVSSWILASASVERCLCITMPLTFKSIITPKRSMLYITIVFVVMAASVAPTFYTSRLVSVFEPTRNRTLTSLTFTADRFSVDNIAFAFGVFLSVTSFLSVAIFTAVLVYKLREATQWREKSVVVFNKGNTQLPSLTHRNKQVGKMVSLISIFFIVCFTPNTVNQLVMSLVPEFAKNGSQVNANQVSWSFGFLLESLNATVNFFIYLKMSSRYRDTLRMILWGRQVPEHDPRSTRASGDGGTYPF
ncbi:neurotensin receptor type 2-like [Physella acuta]|uniref:neurotensin receptor type 2-like n=1 Tax=Physella acuta TaxID=109671 RepID=UPI0027DC12B2|nr:neurotensin receptor type 2-like [Physella acuta]